MKKYNGEREEFKGTRDRILDLLNLYIEDKESLESAASILYMLVRDIRKRAVIGGMIIGGLGSLTLIIWAS